MPITQGPPVNIPPEAIGAAIQVGQYFLAGCVILGIGSPLFRWILRRFFEPAPGRTAYIMFNAAWRN